MWRNKKLVFVATALVLVGCAVAPGDDLPIEQELASTEVDDNQSIKVPPPPEEDAATDDEDTSTPAPPSPPDPPGASCAAPDPCASATDLGSVSGDTGSDTVSASGSTSQWFKVRVTENDDDIFGVKLRMRAELTSPSGTNYDLYVYVGGSCSQAATGQSTLTSTTDTVSSSFGEGGTFSNGSSDSKDVIVEVRHVSGPCNASSPWTLTISGNKS